MTTTIQFIGNVYSDTVTVLVTAKAHVQGRFKK